MHTSWNQAWDYFNEGWGVHISSLSYVYFLSISYILLGVKHYAISWLWILNIENSPPEHRYLAKQAAAFFLSIKHSLYNTIMHTLFYWNFPENVNGISHHERQEHQSLLMVEVIISEDITHSKPPSRSLGIPRLSPMSWLTSPAFFSHISGILHCWSSPGVRVARRGGRIVTFGASLPEKEKDLHGTDVKRVGKEMELNVTERTKFMDETIVQKLLDTFWIWTRILI